MDKTDVEGLEDQAEVDALTLLRHLKDEASAIQRHIDLLEDGSDDLDYSNGMPAELQGLREALDALRLVEQRLLKMQLQVQKTVEGEQERFG